MSLTAVPQLSLGADLARNQKTVTLSATSALAVGSILVIGNEVLAVLVILSSTTVTCERGQQGTKAVAHASGTTVYYGASTLFGILGSTNLVTLIGDPGTLPAYTLPVGSRAMDPNTGYEYMLVDCQQAFSIGEIVVIDGVGAAIPITATAKGRVGIIVEAIAASDTWAWALINGQASALLTSDVTTACYLVGGTSGLADILTSTGGNIIYGLTCNAAPSSATDLGTVQISDAFATGVTVSFSSVGT